MVNSVTSQVVLDGSRHAVIKFEGVLDSSDMALTVVVDPATLQGMRNNIGQKASNVRILRIWHNVEDGLSLDLFWQADVNTRISGFSGRGSPSYQRFQGLRNNGGAGSSGRILASSRGWSGIKSFSLIVEVEKVDSSLPASGFILNQLSTPTAFAASPRRINRDYYGASMRVLRSLDNLELDIPFLPSGNLNVFALTNHLSAENFFLWSEDFTNAAWLKSFSAGASIQIIPSTGLSPAGTVGGSTITINRTLTTQAAFVLQRYVMTAGIKCGAVWLQAATSADVGRIIDVWGYSLGFTYRSSHTLTAEWKQYTSPPTSFPGGNFETLTFGYLDNGSSSPDTGQTTFNAWGAQVNTVSLLDYCKTTTAATVSGMNLYISSSVPITQTNTLAAGVYTSSVTGAGSLIIAAGTAVGTGFGTASAGVPVTFTITTAGTITSTVVPTLDTMQLARGSTVGTYIATTTVPLEIGSGFVTVWYDQSGNARDAKPPVAANQPRIANLGLIDRSTVSPSRPALRLDGIAQTLRISALPLPTFLTLSAVGQFAIFGANPILFEHGFNVNSSPGFYLFGNTNSMWAVNRGAINAGVGLVNWMGTSPVQVDFTYDETGVVRKNGAIVSNGSINGSPLSNSEVIAPFHIGSRAGNSFFGSGLLEEFILFSSVLSFSDRITLATNQKLYYGTP